MELLGMSGTGAAPWQRMRRRSSGQQSPALAASAGELPPDGVPRVQSAPEGAPAPAAEHGGTPPLDRQPSSGRASAPPDGERRSSGDGRRSSREGSVRRVVADFFSSASSSSSAAAGPSVYQTAEALPTAAVAATASTPWDATRPVYVPALLDERARPQESLLLSRCALLQLAAQCPTRYACSDWTLLYSTQLHGFSLLTLHRRASACGPCVLVLRARGKDDVRRTFGFVASEWRPPQEPNHFYGTGETFVWQLERLANLPPLLDGSGEPPPDEVLHTYRWSGRNSHFCFSAREHLAVGSGGHFALWLDAELLHGSSGTSETFSNPSLCTGRTAQPSADEEEQEVGEFRCENLEVWGLDERLIRLRRAQLAREEGMRVGW